MNPNQKDLYIALGMSALIGVEAVVFMVIMVLAMLG